MTNPNEDTQWNDALRRFKILPPKQKEFTEDEIVKMAEATVEKHCSNKKVLKTSSSGSDDDDDDADEEDIDSDPEIADLKLNYWVDKEAREIQMRKLRERLSDRSGEESQRRRFGDVLEISGCDYCREINEAGSNIWVVLHLYKPGIPFCSVLNKHMEHLAGKYPTTKFIKAISTTCVPNFPDANLPAIFVYFEGDLKKQLIGRKDLRGPNISADEFEYIIGQSGAIKTDIDVGEELNKKYGTNDYLSEQLNRLRTVG